MTSSPCASVLTDASAPLTCLSAPLPPSTEEDQPQGLAALLPGRQREKRVNIKQRMASILMQVSWLGCVGRCSGAIQQRIASVLVQAIVVGGGMLHGEACQTISCVLANRAMAVSLRQCSAALLMPVMLPTRAGSSLYWRSLPPCLPAAPCRRTGRMHGRPPIPTPTSQRQGLSLAAASTAAAPQPHTAAGATARKTARPVTGPTVLYIVRRRAARCASAAQALLCNIPVDT